MEAEVRPPRHWRYVATAASRAVALGIVAAIALAPITARAENDAPAWKKPFPPGTVAHFKKTGNETFELFPTAKIGSAKDKGLELGGQFSAQVIGYDPTKDDDWDFRVTILDGKYAGQIGWMLSSGAAADDGTPIVQFSGAVISN